MGEINNLILEEAFQLYKLSWVTYKSSKISTLMLTAFNPLVPDVH